MPPNRSDLSGHGQETSEDIQGYPTLGRWQWILWSVERLCSTAAVRALVMLRWVVLVKVTTP